MMSFVKKIILIFNFFLLFTFITLNINVVNASANIIKVNFIFDNISYASGDIIYLNINITDLEKVNEIKMGINNSEELSKYIEFYEVSTINESSGFNKELENEVSDEKGLRLHLQKEAEVVQNTLGQVVLKCKKDIIDIISLINKDITFYLFDEDNKLLDYKIIYSEKLKATWNILIDEVEVYMEAPDYLNSFLVSNRKEEQYQITVKQNIDTSIIGMQVYSIIVFDKINNDQLLFTKAINVVDKTVPCLSYPEVIKINDKEVENLDLSKFIQISDNYDENAKLYYSYYNKEEELLNSFLTFKEYLSSNKEGWISFYGIDSSNNKTDEIKIKINVEDKTAPIIDIQYKDIIKIKDTDLDKFDFNLLFSIKDQYDMNPLLIIEVYNNKNELVENYKDILLEGELLEVRYYGVDNANNKTEIYKSKLTLEDTTPPVISGVSDVNINDCDVSDNFYLEGLNYSDNIDKTPLLEIIFYIGEEKVNKYLFLEKIKKGIEGCISFQVIDSSNNKSEIFLERVKVIDTTAPIIKLVDLKEDGKYLKVEEINYEVSDNFLGEVEVHVEVNGNEYKNTLINEVGNYDVVIYAKDESGNTSKKEFSFKIIENNINGCNGDVKCYVDNYLNVIIIVSVLTIVSISLVVVKIVLEKKKEKNKLKEIKNENI